jgi:hypothetical protein
MYSFISTPARALSPCRLCRALSPSRRELYLRAGYVELYLHAGESSISVPAMYSFTSTTARALSPWRLCTALSPRRRELYLHAGESSISAPAMYSFISAPAIQLHDRMMYNFKCQSFGCNTAQYCKLTPMSRMNMLPPFSRSKIGTARTSNMFGSTYKSYNQTDYNVNTNRRENLKNIIYNLFSVLLMFVCRNILNILVNYFINAL